jgi:hypothetical protein
MADRLFPFLASLLDVNVARASSIWKRFNADGSVSDRTKEQTQEDIGIVDAKATAVFEITGAVSDDNNFTLTDTNGASWIYEFSNDPVGGDYQVAWSGDLSTTLDNVVSTIEASLKFNAARVGDTAVITQLAGGTSGNRTNFRDANGQPGPNYTLSNFTGGASASLKFVPLGDFVTTATNYSVLPGDRLISATATLTATLPSAGGLVNNIKTIKNAGSGTVTITADGAETIDDEPSHAITPGEALMVQSDGTNWIII